MFRQETEGGYWLITHRDHARLAEAFATHWGNATFARPEPRRHVLHAIHAHDDGWAVRDAKLTITREGKPSAFSIELAGKYAAFDEIDMTEYLAARRKAVAQVSATDPYAALLISMHTVNLLTERADRSTIAPAQLPLLDAFLREQAGVQHNLRNEIEDDLGCSSMDISNATIQKNFRLLQACHHWSELGCVGFAQPSSRLHPLATTDGGASAVLVTASAPRRFRLEPYPLDEPDLRFEVPARYVEGQTFASDEELQEKFAAAQAEGLTITVHP